MKAEDEFSNAAAATEREVPRVAVTVEVEHSDGEVAAQRCEALTDAVEDACTELDDEVLGDE